MKRANVRSRRTTRRQRVRRLRAHRQRVRRLRARRQRVRRLRALRQRRVRRVRGTRRSRGVRRLRARRGFHQLRGGPGFIVNRPAHAWGRAHVLRHLRTAFAAYHTAFPDSPPMMVRDLSRRRGGYFWPHKSHRRGTDVDIRTLLSNPGKRHRRATPRTLNVAATWLVLSRLLATRDVVYIFIDYPLQRALYRHAKARGVGEEVLEEFQYPRGRRRRVGTIRHADGHADHIHVRFRSVPRPRPAPLVL